MPCKNKYEPEENQVHRNNWVSGVDGKFTFPFVHSASSSARRARRARHETLGFRVLPPRRRNNLVYTTSVQQKRTGGSAVRDVIPGYYVVLLTVFFVYRWNLMILAAK